VDEKNVKKAGSLWTLIRVVILLAVAGVIGKHFYLRRVASQHANRGIELAEQGKYEESIVELEKALAIDPRLEEAREQLGEMCRQLAEDYSHKNAWAETAKYCRRAIKLGFTDKNVYWRQTEALWRLKKYDEALAANEAHAAAYPDDHRPESMDRAIKRDKAKEAGGGE